MEIHYLNVDEGDCSIVKHDSGRISMIDICCGNISTSKTESVKNAVAGSQEGMGILGNFNQKEHPVNPLEWLRYISNDRIFRFILTHPDMDHMDGIKALFDSQQKPHNFWDTNNEKKLDTNGNFGKYLAADWKCYEDLHLKKGEDITFLRLNSGAKGKFYNQNDDKGNGEGDRIFILSPSSKTEDVVEDSGNVNDISYVILMKTASGRKILFCGDAEECAWNLLLRRHEKEVSNIDILIPPHHGRKSGGNDAFLDILKPKITIFGNAKAEYLDYDSWNNRELLHFTNNEIGSVVFEEVDGKFEVWATGKKYIAKWREKLGLNYSTEETLYRHDRYPVWFLTRI